MKQQLLSGVLAIALFSTVSLPLAEAATYKVQPGDTLYRIAQKHKVSVADLKSWNKLSSDSLYANQSLNIGNAVIAAPKKVKNPVKAKVPVKVSAPAPSTGTTTYIVKKGDSLYSIAKKYGVTADQIIVWNKLASTNLLINQSLKIGNAKQPSKVVPVSAEKPTPVPAPAPIAAPVGNQASSVYAAALKIAYSLERTPYVFGGASPSGFDCSGFIYYVYSQAGLKVSRTDSVGFYNLSSEITNPAIGDLVFFQDTYKPGISHMGIFVGNNSFIHAGSKGIEVSNLDTPYWNQHFVGFKRLKALK
jgi:peptidoglycan DL-endopeptidase LytE